MANQTTEKAIWDRSGFRIFKQWRQKPWGMLLVLALFLYFGSLGYQAGKPARDACYLAWATAQLPDTPENLTLAIAYPRIVRLEAPDKPGWPLSVYLWPPVLPITPTVAGMPSSATPAVTATAPALTPTLVTPTLTPTPTQAISYTVAFLPYDDGLLFTDEKGAPVAPQVMVRPGQSPDEPAVLYVRRAPMDPVPLSVPITVSIYGLGGNPQELATLEVRSEDTYDAWRRHFLDLVLGPTTPLLALAATLVGFGWQWWQEGQKRKQAAQDEIREVETLVSLRKLEEARQKLVEVTIRYGRDPGLRDDLTKARKCVCLARIRRLHEIRGRVERREEAHREYEDLQKESEKEGWTDPELIASLKEAEVAIKRLPLKWPRLWPEETQRPDLPAIVAWLKESGTDLEFNPFGAEQAEEDPLLPQLFVEPPGWELMKAPEPTVVFGADGSGRTASGLLLAHTCTTTGLGPKRIGGQVDTFPVRLTLFPEGKPDEAAVICWRMLTRALAQAALDFLALNPQTFAETPFRQQCALARLFSLHRHYLGDLAGYLEGAGLDGAIAVHLAENIQQAARGTRPPALADEAELLATLAEARLSPFQQCYVLARLPDEVSIRLSPERIVPHLGPWLQIMQPMAARKVYLKLFVPASVKPLLESLLPQVTVVELLWEALTLEQMLEWRVQQAGAASFRALFGHLPRGIDPTEHMVQAALKSEGPPRRLIQLGQELLAEHIRRTPGDHRLRWEELKAVLEKSVHGGEL